MPFIKIRQNARKTCPKIKVSLLFPWTAVSACVDCVTDVWWRCRDAIVAGEDEILDHLLCNKVYQTLQIVCLYLGKGLSTGAGFCPFEWFMNILSIPAGWFLRLKGSCPSWCCNRKSHQIIIISNFQFCDLRGVCEWFAHDGGCEGGTMGTWALSSECRKGT